MDPLTLVLLVASPPLAAAAVGGAFYVAGRSWTRSRRRRQFRKLGLEGNGDEVRGQWKGHPIRVRFNAEAGAAEPVVGVHLPMGVRSPAETLDRGTLPALDSSESVRDLLQAPRSIPSYGERFENRVPQLAEDHAWSRLETATAMALDTALEVADMARRYLEWVPWEETPPQFVKQSREKPWAVAKRRDSPPADDGDPHADDPTQSLLEDLRGEGAATTGRFTVDHEHALESLKTKRLADPSMYPTEFMALAHHVGATEADVRLTLGATTFAFNRPPRLHPQGALGAALEGVPAPLALLGHGVFGALQHGAEAVDVCTPDGSATFHDDGQVDVPGPSTAAWHIRVRYPLRRAYLGNQISTSCRDAWQTSPVVVRVAGRSADREDGGQVEPFVFEHEDIRGTIAFTSDGAERVRMVVDGVWVDSAAVPGWPEGCLATVSCPRLLRNLSRSQLVENDVYHDAIEQVRLHLRDGTAHFAAMVEHWDDDAAERLRRAVAATNPTLAFITDLAPPVRDAPVWPTACGARCTMGQILDALAETGRVHFSSYRVASDRLEWVAGTKAVLDPWAIEKPVLRFLATVFRDDLHGVADTLWADAGKRS